MNNNDDFIALLHRIAQELTPERRERAELSIALYEKTGYGIGDLEDAE